MWPESFEPLVVFGVLAVAIAVVLALMPRKSAFDAGDFLAGADGSAQGHRRRVAVVLNPVAGGQGQAHQIWARVKRVFDEHAPTVELTCLETRAAGHARQWAAEEFAGDADTIVCIGGDGTLFEVVNGLLSRADAQALAATTALAVIPAGSGNGLARSLGVRPGEVEKAAAMAIRNKRGELGIVKAQRGSESPRFCFLFAAYGLIADVDFESEAYRFVGGLRFVLAGIVRIFFQRCYPVRLQIEPASEGRPIELDTQIAGLLICNCPWVTYDFLAAPKADMSDGLLDVIIGTSAMTRLEMARMLIFSESGGHMNFPSVQYVKAKSLRIEAAGDSVPSFCFDDATRKGQFDLDGEPFPSNAPLELSAHDVRLQIIS